MVFFKFLTCPAQRHSMEQLWQFWCELKILGKFNITLPQDQLTIRAQITYYEKNGEFFSFKAFHNTVTHFLNSSARFT